MVRLRRVGEDRCQALFLAQDGGGSVIYAFLTIVGENGRQQHAAVEMTPAAAN